MALSTGMRKGVGYASAALALLAATVGAMAADPEPASPTLTTPTITEVGGKTLKEWIDDLKKGDPSEREEAIRAIVLFPKAYEAVPALIDKLHDPDASPRIKAVLALGMIKIDDKDKELRSKIVDALAARMPEEPQAPIRYDIAVTLGGMGEDARGALPALLHGVEDQSSFEIRKACISILARVGQTDKGPDVHVTQTLIAALGDRAAQVRLQAVMALADLGKPADAALLAHEITRVKALEADKDKTVVIWAHFSMMFLDKIDDHNIDFLTKCSQPGELERIRVQAIGALGMVGTKEKKVVPTLVDLLSEKDAPNIVGSACQALGAVGDPGEKAETALAELARNDKMDEPLRDQAVYALARVTAKDKKALDILISLLSDKNVNKNTNVLTTLCHVLGSIDDPKAEQSLVILSQNKDTDESVRKYIEKVLESIAKPKK